jgi:hypothetical protein
VWGTVLDVATGFVNGRQNCEVLVHRGFFTNPELAGLPQHFFIKVTNQSRERDVVITHVWFNSDPPTYLINPYRPLPARLSPSEQYETWKAVDDVPDPKGEWLVRVKLSSGKVIKGRPNRGVTPQGEVAGGGTHV